MDTQKQASFFPYTLETLPPAQLWIGSHDYLVNQVQRYGQTMFCPHNGCQTCTICMQIRDKQHHAFMWIYPEKTYVIEQFDDLFSTIAFKLQENEHFFFILQKADFLTHACANKLLKSMEEPPAGYHFILLAERIDEIAPTIVSRCITHTIQSNSLHHQEHPLFTCFTVHMPSMLEFSKILDSSSINERESRELLDKILAYWTKQYKADSEAWKNKASQAYAIISLLKNTYTQLPMPGSSLIFWRNLYLSIVDLFVIDKPLL